MRVDLYAQTVLDFVGGPSVDLRVPLDDAGREALVEHVGAREFAIITAENPFGRVAPPQANIAANARLRRLVTERGLSYRVVVGRSPDGSHQEQSLAVVVSLEGACQLGAVFEQVAVFWFDGGRFYLVACRAGGGSVALPLEG